MLVLLGIGLLAGFVTAISPCVLPVLPLLLGGSVTGGSRRPYAIVAGIVASFTVFTLFATALLDAVGLPQDFLRNLALVLIFALAAGLIFPHVGRLLERPFYRLGRRSPGDVGGGLVLGLSLGLVFVPCAGPALAVVSVKAAESDVTLDVAALMLAYAVGAAVPMLAVALAGQRASERTRALRAHAGGLRRAAGLVLAVVGAAIALGADRPFQTAVPGYTASLQRVFEENRHADARLAALRGTSRRQSADDGSGLRDEGPAHDFVGITHWLNTPGERPLTLSALRGKVVVLDFWTYSCINCLRTLPYLKGWYEQYRGRGLVIVGVHSPEFAFERELDNVRGAVRRLGLRYPIALDNSFETWRAYQNQYWPAKYFIDRRGHLRWTHFGEGAYGRSERVIRTLLGEPGGPLPVARRVRDRTPTARMTPETYLGYERLDRYAGSGIVPDTAFDYSFPPSLLPSTVAYAGTWRVERERIVAADEARLRLRFTARKVFLVLSGSGRVDVLLDGRPRGSIRVAGDRLYTLLSLAATREGLLELRVSQGVAAYAFTFG